MNRSGGVIHSTVRGAGPDETITVARKADGTYAIAQYVPEASYTHADMVNLHRILVDTLWYSADDK